MNDIVKKMDFVNYAKRLRDYQKGNKDKFTMLELAINSQCNLRCSHCSAADLTTATSEFELEELNSLFEQAAKEGFLTVVLVGGEPTIYPFLKQAIKLIKNHGMLPSMITNGYNIAESDLKEWDAAGLGTICFSLHGSCSKTHDSFVNVAGAFEKIMHSINLATKLGIKVAISVTPTHEQIRSGEFYEIMDFIRKNEFAINFNYPAVAGRYKNCMMDLLTQEELNLVKEASIGLKQWSDFYLTGEYRCIAAKNGIYISVEGDVLPCAFIHIKFGNIKNTSLSLILDEMRANKFFNKVHNYCLVGEDPIFVKDYISPIYENGNIKPLDYKKHCLIGNEDAYKISEEYTRIFNAVVSENKLFEKSLLEMKDYLEQEKMGYSKYRQEVSSVVIKLLEQYNMEPIALGKAYKRIVINFLKNQKSYNLTGKYPAMEMSVDNIRNKVYDSKDYMTDYMLCLLITYILWPNKYNLIRSFETDFAYRLPDNCSILDIGTGHGYFLAKALQESDRRGVGVDLSEHSLIMAQRVMDIAEINSEKYKLIMEDITNGSLSTQKFDAIIFSEVIEHVEDPNKLLQFIRGMLNKGNYGIFFVTALNTATDDHIQVFRSQNDVRKLLKENGYSWKNERVYPQFGFANICDPEEIKNKKIPAAYSAIIYPQ